MPNILKTIGKQVEQAQLILANTQDQEVKNKMAQYNVGPEKPAEGQKLLDTVVTIINQTNDVHMERKNAVKCFDKAALEAKRYFWNHAAIAKYVMDPVMLADLNLKGRLKVSFTGWFEEANNFYNAVLRPDSEKAAAIMASVGITREILHQGKQMLDDLIPLYAEKAYRKDKSKDATEFKIFALKQLTKWNRHFIFFAKRAFKDNPKQLTRFGYIPATVQKHKPAPPPTIQAVTDGAVTDGAVPTYIPPERNPMSFIWLTDDTLSETLLTWGKGDRQGTSKRI